MIADASNLELLALLYHRYHFVGIEYAVVNFQDQTLMKVQLERTCSDSKVSGGEMSEEPFGSELVG